MLDGMRAQYDYSGWGDQHQHPGDGPLRRQRRGADRWPTSFYTNWDAPSNFNNQPFRYMWNCVIEP